MKFFFAPILLLTACSGAPFTLADQQTPLDSNAASDAQSETVIGISFEWDDSSSPPDHSSPEAAPVDAPPLPLDVDAGATWGDETSAPEASPDCVTPPTFEITPTSVHFGKVLIGSTTAPIYVSLINRGACTSSPDVGGFGIPTPFTDPSTCANARLAPNGACVFEVSFTPPGAGDFHGVVQGTVWGQSMTFSVDGTGVWSL